MNTNLSISLRPKHRFLTIFLNMITTQTQTHTINSFKINNQSFNSFLSNSNFPSDLITLSFFLRSTKHINQNSFAFDRMIPVINRLIHRFNSPQTILSELHSIGSFNFTNINTNPNYFLLLLRILSRIGNHKMLIDTCRYLIDSHGFVIVQNTFASNLLMDSLFRISESKIAFSVFQQTKNPNFLTFNIALFHFSNLNDIVNVVDVLRQMLSLGYYPNHGTFSAVLNSFCKMNSLPQVYQILGLMVGLGVELSVNVWTVIIHKFCKLRRLDVAANLFYNMIRTGCSPNVVTYTALIKAFMESNMVSDALHLWNKMLSDGLVPDLVFCNVLIDCLSKVGKYGDAIKAFLWLSEQKNIKPDLYTYTSLLSTICLSERFNLLPKLVQVCVHVNSDLVFCNALLSSYVKAGRPHSALVFYNRMIDEGFEPDNYTFAGLLSALCAARRIDDAVNVYCGVVRKADAHIHTVITSELLKAGKHYKATVVFRSAAVNKYLLDSVAYAVGIRALLRDGKTLEANTLYDQMKDTGLEPNVETFNMMLFSSCKEKDLQMVEQLLTEMIDSRMKLNDRSFFQLCKFPSSLDGDFSVLKLLLKMKDLGLLSAKALHALSFDKHAESGKEKYIHCGEVDTECNLVLDSSSSDDMSDVAVSV